jgi:hypothetical protein
MPKKLTLINARKAVPINGTHTAGVNRLVRQSTIVVDPSPHAIMAIV